MADDDFLNAPWTILHGVAGIPRPQSPPIPPAQNTSPPVPSGWNAYPDIRHAAGLSPPSDKVGALLNCIVAQAGPDFTVSSTSDRHAAGDPHTEGLAADVLADKAKRVALMQAAADCGAVYQQDEYVHPSPQSTGGHLHFQMRPGLRGATGPYRARSASS